MIFNMGKLKFLELFSAHKKENPLSTSVEVPDERLRVFISSAQSNGNGNNDSGYSYSFRLAMSPIIP